MALFSKEKKVSERDKLLGQKIKDVRYRSLTEALKGEISINSKDAKITYFTFPDERELTVISAAGKVLLARDSARPIDLVDFLYWSDLAESTKSSVLMLAAGAPLNEGLISAISAKSPEALMVLKKAIYDTTLESLKVIFDEFDSYELIDTELYKNNDVVKALVPQGIDLTTVESSIVAAENRVKELEKLLGITVDYSYVKLSENKAKSSELVTPEEKIVSAAADASATLKDTEGIASGFRWVSVLQQVHELADRGLIKIEIDAPFEALPDSFDVLHPYEKLFRLTRELSSDLEPLALEVFDISGDLELVTKLVKDNGVLEQRVLDVEDMLIKLLQGEDYEEFVDLDIELQDSVRVLVLDRAEANEKRLTILQRVKDLTLVDTETAADGQLRELIELKLQGIHHATDELPLLQPDISGNHFQIPEDEPEFNFNDGRLVLNANGELQVQEISPHDIHDDEEPLAINQLVGLVHEAAEDEPEIEDEVAPLDLGKLEDHLINFGPTRRRKRAARATESFGKELGKLSD